MTPHEIIQFIDLTRLGDDDWPSIEALYRKGHTEYGDVAALCVWPKFVEPLRQLTSNDSIQIATVVNFPLGIDTPEHCNRDTLQAIKSGANEIDLVLPYQDLLSGEQHSVIETLKATQEACQGKAKLKVIIESGVLHSESNIKTASELCIENGCDFIKTSTGKVAVNATLTAAKYILETIKTSGLDIGFKASGGIVNEQQAQQYLILFQQILDHQVLSPNRFRFGASSLLDDLLSLKVNANDTEQY